MLPEALRELPLGPHLDGLIAHCLTSRRLALKAEPGAGKTSALPLALAEALGPRGGKVLVLEPRRIACVQAAARLAELTGTTIGDYAGFRMRGETLARPTCRVEFATAALLPRMLARDPALEGYEAVVLDEFHERSLALDLGLALALDAASIRPELIVLPMSATLDTAPLAAFLGGAPAVECPGRGYPVAIRYLAPRGASLEEACVEGIRAAFAEGNGDILCFLPGMAEIRRVAALANGITQGGGGIEVHILHSSVPLADQRRVLRGGILGGPRRLILATDIAETSLTVPGVDAVVDSGLAKSLRHDARTGLDRLMTVRISEARAEQRRGRAGRLGPGLCVRLWDPDERLESREAPEILRAELSGLVLECALWGVREPGTLRWLDSPLAEAWERGRGLLAMLGLIDTDGRPTQKGELAARVGLGPRMGAMMAEGSRLGDAPLAARACAAIIAGEPPSIAGSVDLAERLISLDERSGALGGWAEGCRREVARILASLGDAWEGTRTRNGVVSDATTLGRIALAAYPDRVAMLDKGSRAPRYRLASGRLVEPALEGRAGSGTLATALPQWIVAVDAAYGEGPVGKAWLWVEVSAEGVVDALKPEEAWVFEWEGLRAKAFRVRSIGVIEISRTPGRPPEGTLGRAFAERVKCEGLGVLPWGQASRGLLERLRFYASRACAPLAESLSDEALGAEADMWLVPFVDASRPEIIDDASLARALKARAGHEAVARAEKACPDRLELPSGRSCAISYADRARARVESRLQDFIGMDTHPLVMGEPILICLLSPAGRLVQLTSDLPGYWRGAYAGTRKDMRGRYPKHAWPEEPWKQLP